MADPPISPQGLARYRLPETLPPSGRITLDALPPYLAAAGSAPFGPHLHEFHQVLWFRSGSGKHLVDFVEYEYRPQTLVYIPSGAVHAFRRDPAVDGAILHFEDSMALGAGDQNSLAGLLRVLTLQSQPLRILTSPQSTAIQADFDAVSNELRADASFGKAIAVEAALRLLLVHSCRLFQESPEPPTKDHARYTRFLALVELHHAEGLSVDAYAKLLGVSSKTLSRTVRQSWSSSPGQVIADRVVLEMKRLLIHTDLSVKEIAAQVGMADASYATRFFRKYSSVAPSAFRQSWR